mgnify:CR=1 FL=1
MVIRVHKILVKEGWVNVHRLCELFLEDIIDQQSVAIYIVFMLVYHGYEVQMDPIIWKVRKGELYVNELRV